MIISRTPLRFSIAGGGTDIPSFYKKNKFGKCINFSIDNYIYVILNKQSNLYNEKFRLNYSETELVKNINNIKNPIIKGCLQFLNFKETLYISTTSDVPAASGLGTSSAFCVGLLNALYKYKGVDASHKKLAEEASHIEINILKRPVGKQDHYSAAYGGLNIFKFNSNETVNVNKIQLNNNISKNINNSLISFWTGISRNSSNILKKQKKNSLKNTRQLIKLRDQVMETKNILIKKDYKIEQLGMLMTEGWRIKKNLTNNISNRKLDKIYNEAINSGSLGGKLAGAGGGGFFLFVCKKENQNKLIKNMHKKKLTKFNFKISKTGSVVKNFF